MADIDKKGLFKKVDDFDATGWRWPHFSPKELSCKCNKHCKGEYYHDPKFMDMLERFRVILGAPVVINSGRRCPKHNVEAGGASQSQHMLAIAVDIKIEPHTRKDLWNAAAKVGFTENGMGFGSSFLHLDNRGHRSRWDYGTEALRRWSKALGFNPKTGEVVR